MFGTPGALGTQVFEGAFIYAPYTRMPPTVVAGAGGLVAGTGGIAQGRFGWADLTTGLVTNARTAAAQARGLVMPQMGGWSKIYTDPAAPSVLRIRQGLALTLAAGGNFWVRFPGGAFVGESCYADIVDGHAVSGYAVGAELTPWRVVSSANPGELAKISTYAYFGG